MSKLTVSLGNVAGDVEELLERMTKRIIDAVDQSLAKSAADNATLMRAAAQCNERCEHLMNRALSQMAEMPGALDGKSNGKVGPPPHDLQLPPSSELMSPQEVQAPGDEVDAEEVTEGRRNQPFPRDSVRVLCFLLQIPNSRSF
eukprot:TRINITY_DN19698_c0_g1_i1.p1 TRINITY_DN19698_c0_g1~~TRINITY_DN19698_c0_g1_i1.p1  ORF type:complete len:144 (-),score=31.65 TRINITY_DN19698_c0_g1_i1:110-541(-)